MDEDTATTTALIVFRLGFLGIHLSLVLSSRAKYLACKMLSGINLNALQAARPTNLTLLQPKQSGKCWEVRLSCDRRLYQITIHRQ